MSSPDINIWQGCVGWDNIRLSYGETVALRDFFLSTRPRATRVYIAGPMSGLPEFNYPAFHDAAAKLGRAGYAILNPADAEDANPTPGTPQPWDWYMRQALHKVADADGIALLPGWEKSRGATLEHQIGKALGLTIHPLRQWLCDTGHPCAGCPDCTAIPYDLPEGS